MDRLRRIQARTRQSRCQSASVVMEYKERAREAEAASMTTAAPAMEVVEAPSGRKSNQKNRHAAAVRIAQHESGVRLAIAGPRVCFLGWRTSIPLALRTPGPQQSHESRYPGQFSGPACLITRNSSSTRDQVYSLSYCRLGLQ